MKQIETNKKKYQISKKERRKNPNRLRLVPLEIATATIHEYPRKRIKKKDKKKTSCSGNQPYRKVPGIRQWAPCQFQHWPIVGQKVLLAGGCFWPWLQPKFRVWWPFPAVSVVSLDQSSVWEEQERCRGIDLSEFHLSRQSIPILPLGRDWVPGTCRGRQFFASRRHWGWKWGHSRHSWADWRMRQRKTPGVFDRSSSRQPGGRSYNTVCSHS